MNEIKRRLLNSPSYPRDFVREVKWFIQRGRRGWSDRDSWSIADFWCRVMPEVVDHMISISHSTGATKDPETGKYEFDDERWMSVLREISLGFKAGRAILDLEPLYSPYNPSYDYAQENQELDRAFDLMKEHFLGLWD